MEAQTPDEVGSDCTALQSPHAYQPNSENFYKEWHLKHQYFFFVVLAYLGS